MQGRNLQSRASIFRFFRRRSSLVTATLAGMIFPVGQASAQIAPPRPPVPMSGDFNANINRAMQDMLRQHQSPDGYWDRGFGDMIEGIVIWESEGIGESPQRDEAQEIRTRPDGTIELGGPRRTPPAQQQGQVNRQRPGGGGGGGAGGGQSNLVSGGGGGGGTPFVIRLPRLQLRDSSASAMSTNGFTSVSFLPIYQNSTVYQTATFGPSSAGLSGYDAVPWISRWGNGVSSAGSGVSSLGGAGQQLLDYRTNTGIFQQVTWLRTQGRLQEAQDLLDRTAPAQFGGTIGAAQNTAFYMGLIQSFIGGDTARLEAIYNSEAALQAIGGATGLSPDAVRAQLAYLNGLDLYRGAFIRTAAGDLIGVGGMGLIRGQLIWTNNADLDLHMYVPGGSPSAGGAGHVYYANRTVTFNSGGATAQLDRDNLGGTIDAAPNRRVENIVVTGNAIPPGSYSFFVFNFSANGNVTTNYTLTLTGDGGRTVQTVSGALTNRQQSATTPVTSPGGRF